MKDIEVFLDEVISKEGNYSFDPADSGGETNFGITKFVANSFGYTGQMKDLTKDIAKEIYRKRYWIQPKFDQIYLISQSIALMLTDIGINMGPATGVKFLQRALNVLNNGGTAYPDMTVDGVLGVMTITSLKKFLNLRGTLGESVIIKLINSQRAVRYMEISEASPKNERFTYGWIANRVE